VRQYAIFVPIPWTLYLAACNFFLLQAQLSRLQLFSYCKPSGPSTQVSLSHTACMTQYTEYTRSKKSADPKRKVPMALWARPPWSLRATKMRLVEFRGRHWAAWALESRQIIQSSSWHSARLYQHWCSSVFTALVPSPSWAWSQADPATNSNLLPDN
jgi:hypothetical protein